MNRWIQDAGHGGSDSGATHEGLKEKEWTLEAALYVFDRLNELGIQTDITRTEDITLDRHSRTEMVRQYDRAISHHFNAGGGAGAEFIHSIYAEGEFEQKLEEEFAKSGYPIRRTFTRTYPGNDQQDYYYMNRETGDCRVTIVEYGFLDGPHLNQLKDRNYRVGMYECVIRAICREEGIDYRQPGDSEVYYRVVAGSFKEYNNATKYVDTLKDKGFDAFVARHEISSRVYYRVIVGSYKKRKNAEKQVEVLDEVGVSSFIDAYQS
ncbi:N-acetylmuramoyl-L-alanine amidase [Alkalibacillus aidingensis]|uniref:N-acetylmuramoyl-L-alanine amidase n=1 Tax=Alkalibacillus aidingensis TaxID=2747607 RepID=UPI0016604256|nr:N-acetylmuramoyl-L-alanine amidase [Alkalibacillus aidingensis]